MIAQPHFSSSIKMLRKSLEKLKMKKFQSIHLFKQDLSRLQTYARDREWHSKQTRQFFTYIFPFKCGCWLCVTLYKHVQRRDVDEQESEEASVSTDAVTVAT